ncbi:ABC-2 type transport system permease protein [Oscillospiraceae bacterium]|nr:ABC-2 type transport system permease protein [Oscillospiraceae bacterium]
MFAVFKREFFSYFKSPVGYIALALFAFISGYQYINMFAYAQANIASEIISMISFFVVFVPIITMGLLSEDKKRGTEILYYTNPVSLFDVVLGKFLAALALFGIMFVNIIIHIIITKSSKGSVGIGVLGASVVFFFVAALYIAIGLFTSSLTDSQIISAILSFVFLLIFQMLATLSTFISNGITSLMTNESSDATSIAAVGEKIANAVKWLDPLAKTQEFRYGVFSVFPLVYCVSLALVFLYLTFRVLEKKRWSQK